MIQNKKNLLTLIFSASAPFLAHTQNVEANTGTGPVKFTKANALEITPSASSSQDDFDFLQGKWTVHNRKLKARLNNSDEWNEFESEVYMRKTLAGIGNVENYYATFEGKPFEGMAVRLFNQLTKLWTIYWVDNNSGVMDQHPVTGSFENGLGKFYAKDVFDDKDIIVLYQWDATNPRQPIWSQAFSTDNGKTWEWNWYMYFTREEKDSTQNLNANQHINVLELRNYSIKPEQRDRFIDYFEDNFIQSQNIIGGYTLGQFRVKRAEDNFFWIRGFHDMDARDKFLNSFYYGAFWKQHKNAANAMLSNNDNVYLLKPLNISNDVQENTAGFNSNWFGAGKGIAVIDYFIANEKLDKLIPFIRNKYAPVLKSAGIEHTSFWISETKPNEFTALPVFQDKNLLVNISFYKDELEYQSQLKAIETAMTEEEKNEMQDIVTIKTSLLLYPTKRSFLLPG